MNILNDIIHGNQSDIKKPIILQPELIIGCTSVKKSYDKNSHDTLKLKNEIYSYIVSNISKSNSQLLHELIAKLSYNKKYFSGKFKMLFDDTFINVVSEIKIRQSALEIQNTGKHILQILVDYGFASHQIFRRSGGS
jgi:AraC-like DNA-binding protein